MKHFLTVIFLIINSVAFAQSPVKLLNTCDFLKTVKSENAGKYKLVMIGNKGCGYSQMAMKQLMQFSEQTNLKIVVVEYGFGEKDNLSDSRYFDTYQFIRPTDCLLAHKPDFFPQFILLDKGDKVVWKKKGWFNRNLEEIQRKINRTDKKGA